MGRKLHSVIRIEGDLVAKTPVHSGGLRDSVFTDLPLAVNGKGKVYFPGSAIAGPLRAWWRSACRELEDEVWGRVERQGGNNDGWASILFVHDAPLINAIDLDRAQHVAIDHRAGTAEFDKKFDRELAPVEAQFRLCLELQRPAGKYGPTEEMDDQTWKKIQSVLRGMLEDLCKGEIRFGADKSRGRGKLILQKEKISSRDLGRGILDTLLNDASTKGIPIPKFFGKTKPIRPSRQQLKLFLKCQPIAPVMQRHEAEGKAVDMLPAVAVEGDKRKPFLAGTGIKGAFRAQSARILRTVLGCEDADEDSLYLVGALYGAAKKAETENRKRKKVPQSSLCDPDYRESGRGAVSFDDCRMDRPLCLADWQRLLKLDTSSSTERLAHFKNEARCTAWANFRPVAHVAIDRWTGGAANKFLFSRLEPTLDDFVLTATIDFERIAPPLDWWIVPCGCDPKGKKEKELVAFRRAALALFLLTLRDFARGRIPLGYGVNRGLGDLDLTEATFAGLKAWKCVEMPVEMMPDSLTADDFDEKDKMEAFRPLQEAWSTYIKKKKLETES